MAPIGIKEIPSKIRKQLGHIHHITFPGQGQTSDVGIIHSARGVSVLKRAKGRQFSEWLEREAYVLECLAQTDLKVPQIYDFVQRDDEEDEDAIESWLLMEHMEGETLLDFLADEDDPVTRYHILFQFGRTLRRIHSTPCPDGLVSDVKWLDRMLEQAEYNLEHFNAGTEELLEELRNNKPEDIEPTLIHGDFTVDNVLVDEGGISGIIDWSGGAYGDPRYDVALAIRPKQVVFENEDDLEAFFDGYGKKIINDEEYDYFERGLYTFF